MRYLEYEYYNIANLAHKALIVEATVSPKPGLVDRFNCGAHTDMDIFTFIESAFAIQPYFYLCAQLGGRKSIRLGNLFLLLRNYGINAEKAMMKATNGVNTHKGAIFSMGILTAAAAYSAARGVVDAETISSICAQICEGIIERDLVNNKVNKSNQITAGERLFADYGITGVRGEAQAGFPTVINISLPIFKSLIENNVSLNDTCVQTLLHLISHTCDTNVLARTGFRGLEFAQSSAKTILEKGGFLKDKKSVFDLDRDFIARNISPGGCADLLAATYFLYFLEAKGA